MHIITFSLRWQLYNFNRLSCQSLKIDFNAAYFFKCLYEADWVSTLPAIYVFYAFYKIWYVLLNLISSECSLFYTWSVIDIHFNDLFSRYLSAVKYFNLSECFYVYLTLSIIFTLKSKVAFYKIFLGFKVQNMWYLIFLSNFFLSIFLSGRGW